MSTSKYCLGTAQLGIKNYGINNTKKDIPDSNKIFDFLIRENLSSIDSSNYYGTINEQIKNYRDRSKLKIYTKIGYDKDLEYFFQNTDLSSIEGCYIHHFEDYLSNKSLYDGLLKFQENSKIKKIGFSIYYEKELEEIIKRNLRIQMIQIPYNVFDQRFEKYFEILNEMKIEINVRSCFLQGLFFRSRSISSDVNLNKKLELKLDTFNEIIKKSDLNITQACYLFCSENKSINQVIVGNDDLIQLKNNIQDLRRSGILQNFDSIKKDLKSLSEKDERIILPFLWSVNEN